MNGLIEEFDIFFSVRLTNAVFERCTTEIISKNLEAYKEKWLQGPQQALLTMMHALSPKSLKIQLRQGPGNAQN